MNKKKTIKQILFAVNCMIVVAFMSFLCGFTTNFFRTLIIPKKTKGGLVCYSKEKCKMRARYIETKTVGKKDPKQFYVIEVSNITILENENILNYQYVLTQNAEDIPKQ